MSDDERPSADLLLRDATSEQMYHELACRINERRKDDPRARGVVLLEATPEKDEVATMRCGDSELIAAMLINAAVEVTDPEQLVMTVLEMLQRSGKASVHPGRFPGSHRAPDPSES